MAERILIVDDEETLCEVLKLNLENEGYDVDIAFSAEEALTYDLKGYSLILLDIMMGEISGIKMAKMLKADVATADIPIIFCTARDSEDDMVMGLNIGADDYIMKPYTVRNVIARVKSVLRRTAGHKSSAIAEKPHVLKVEGLCLDLEFKRCTVDGEEGEPYEEYVASHEKPFDDLRITLITISGAVIYDNTISIDSLDNHHSRPEVAAALKHGSGYHIGRHSTSDGRPAL